MEKNNSQLTIIRDHPLLFTAIWSDAVIWFWRSKLDDELIDLMERDVATVRKRMTTDYVAFAFLFGEKREPPSEKTRKRMAEILKHSTSNLVARAIVLESEGFKATVTRGAITDINVAAQRRDVPQQTFSSVREATGWLAQSLGRDQNWARDFNKIVTEQYERLKGTAT